jgi:hypothetical protein
MRFILLIFLAISTLNLKAAETNAPYVIESFNIAVRGRSEPLHMTFRLNTENGKVWRLEGNSYIEISAKASPTSDAESLEQQQDTLTGIQNLKKAIIPRVQFRDANIYDVVDFLGPMCCGDALEPDYMNVILNMSSSNAARNKIPSITLFAENISLLDLITHITDMTGLSYRIIANNVIISDRQAMPISHYNPVNPSHVKLRATFKKIILPSIQFRDANIYDVIDFLAPLAQDLDASDNPDKTGAPMIGLSISPPAPSTQQPHSGVPMVTFQALNISLWDAIQIISDMTGLALKFKQDSIIFMDKPDNEGELIQKSFKVPQEFINSLGNMKNTFESMGVDWGPFMRVSYDKKTELLHVKTVTGDMHHFERALHALQHPKLYPGRYSFRRPANTTELLLLFDQETGHAWKYEIYELTEEIQGVKSDRFTPIHNKDFK